MSGVYAIRREGCFFSVRKEVALDDHEKAVNLIRCKEIRVDCQGIAIF